MCWRNLRLEFDSIAACAALGLMVASAALVACDSRTVAVEQARAPVKSMPAAFSRSDGMEPRPPFDETSITPVETAGASAKE